MNHGYGGKAKRGPKCKYRPEMCEKVIELMSKGATMVQVAAALDLARITIKNWSTLGHPQMIREFYDAMELGKILAQAYWEERLKEAALGENKDANASLMQFVMRHRFRDDYQEIQHIEQRITTKVEELSDEQLAAIASGAGTAETEKGEK